MTVAVLTFLPVKKFLKFILSMIQEQIESVSLHASPPSLPRRRPRRRPPHHCRRRRRRHCCFVIIIIIINTKDSMIFPFMYDQTNLKLF